MEKTNAEKIPLGDFKVITLENPLLSKQAVTSKGIPVPYTNLQLRSEERRVGKECACSYTT